MGTGAGLGARNGKWLDGLQYQAGGSIVSVADGHLDQTKLVQLLIHITGALISVRAAVSRLYVINLRNGDTDDTKYVALQVEQLDTRVDAMLKALGEITNAPKE